MPPQIETSVIPKLYEQATSSNSQLEQALLPLSLPILLKVDIYPAPAVEKAESESSESSESGAPEPEQPESTPAKATSSKGKGKQAIQTDDSSSQEPQEDLPHQPAAVDPQPDNGNAESDDHVESVIFGNRESPFSAGNTTTDIREGIFPKLVLHPVTSSIASFAIQWNVVWKVSDKIQDEAVKRLDMTAVNTHLESCLLGEVPILELDCPESRDFFECGLCVTFNLTYEKLVELAAGGTLRYANIVYTGGDTILASNLVTDMPFGGNSVDTADLLKVKDAVQTKKQMNFHILFNGRHAADYFNNTKQELIAQRPETQYSHKGGQYLIYGPTKAWWKDGRVNPQTGMTKAKNELPNRRVAARTTFFAISDYITPCTYLVENEVAHEKSRTDSFEVNMRFREITPGDENHYWGSIAPNKNRRIERGARFLVQMSTKDGKKSQYWRGEVFSQDVSTPFGDICCLLTRPSGDDTIDGEMDTFEIPPSTIVYFHEQTDDNTVLSRLCDGNYLNCSITLQTSTKAWRRQKTALDTVWKARGTENGKEIFRIVLGNEPANLTAIHPFQHLLDAGVTQAQIDAAVEAETPKFDEEQKKVMTDMTKPIKGRIQLIYGAAGTGKTTVARSIVKVAGKFHNAGQSTQQADNASEDCTRRTKILVVSPINANADELADHIIKDLQSVYPAGVEPIVVRCFNTSTEKDVSKRKAKTLEGKTEDHEDDNSFIPAIPRTSDDMRDVISAYHLHKHLNELHKSNVDGIRDKRVTTQNLQNSLGYLILRVSGFTSKDEEKPDPLRHPDYRTRYAGFNTYVDKLVEGKLTEDEEKSYGEEFKTVREDVLTNIVDVIVTTCSNAQSHFIHEYFKPHWVIVDESTRMFEPEFLGIAYFYFPQLIIMLGDHGQLGAVTKAPMSEAHFGEQGTRAVFVRFILNGYQQMHLITQHRSAPMIVEVQRILSYGVLKTLANMIQHAEVQAASNVLAHMFGPHKDGITMNVAWYEVSDSTSERDVTMSQFNIEHVKAGFNILNRLLNAGVAPEDILIIIPYHAQMDIYRKAMRVFASFYQDSESNDKLSQAIEAIRLVDLRLETVDNVQGTQAGYVILDFVASEELGFLKTNQRVNVGLFRPRWCLIIIGSSADVGKAYRASGKLQAYNRSAFAKLAQFCIDKGIFFHHTPQHNVNAVDEYLEKMDITMMHPPPPDQKEQRKKNRKLGVQVPTVQPSSFLMSRRPRLDFLGIKPISPPEQKSSEKTTPAQTQPAANDGGFSIGDTQFDYHHQMSRQKNKTRAVEPAPESNAGEPTDVLATDPTDNADEPEASGSRSGWGNPSGPETAGWNDTPNVNPDGSWGSSGENTSAEPDTSSGFGEEDIAADNTVDVEDTPATDIAADDTAAGNGADDTAAGNSADDTAAGNGADDTAAGNGADDTAAGTAGAAGAEL